MPTTPFAPEHQALRDSVRRLADGPLGAVAEAVESGSGGHEAALKACADLGLFDLDDVLAEVVAAQELGRLRSGGLTTLLLDRMTTAALGLGDCAVVEAAEEVRMVAGRADGVLPFAVGGMSAQRCLLVEQAAVVDLAGAQVVPVSRPHAWRGAGATTIVLTRGACEAVTLPGTVLARRQLREAAAAVGGAQRTFDDAAAYAQQREAFGRPIARFQVNRHGLADIATKIAAAEALVHDTAWRLAGDRATATAEPAAARLYAGRVANEVADRAVQLHGGYGYTSAFDVSRAWRDAHALRAGDDRRRRQLAAKGAAP